MKIVSNIHQDFVMTHLRSQLEHLSAVLKVIEDQGEFDVDYMYEALKEIETNIRQIRKLCENP
ncbi:MAG TPA: hypothetical protein PLB05_09665 [Candidatus Omnitrophota bacterium]|nr:hypothetical protein [Candidatus Omnitrophota bacterium]HPN57151.1 hypothetical protein [Candidatus Omnitrophota bacterium]